MRANLSPHSESIASFVVSKLAETTRGAHSPSYHLRFVEFASCRRLIFTIQQSANVSRQKPHRQTRQRKIGIRSVYQYVSTVIVAYPYFQTVNPSLVDRHRGPRCQVEYQLEKSVYVYNDVVYYSFLQRGHGPRRHTLFLPSQNRTQILTVS
jgi:hypothetical protein